jgi:hypothetical protein
MNVHRKHFPTIKTLWKKKKKNSECLLICVLVIIVRTDIESQLAKPTYIRRERVGFNYRYIYRFNEVFLADNWFPFDTELFRKKTQTNKLEKNVSKCRFLLKCIIIPQNGRITNSKMRHWIPSFWKGKFSMLNYNKKKSNRL